MNYLKKAGNICQTPLENRGVRGACAAHEWTDEEALEGIPTLKTLPTPRTHLTAVWKKGTRVWVPVPDKNLESWLPGFVYGPNDEQQDEVVVSLQSYGEELDETLIEAKNVRTVRSPLPLFPTSFGVGTLAANPAFFISFARWTRSCC